MPIIAFPNVHCSKLLHCEVRLLYDLVARVFRLRILGFPRQQILLSRIDIILGKFSASYKLCYLFWYLARRYLMCDYCSRYMLSRAKYIIGTVDALRSKPDGGIKWLLSLRKLDLQEVIDALCTLPGVGPKVAACVALFSLDQHQAIPVDTHVWQVYIAKLNSGTYFLI